MPEFLKKFADGKKTKCVAAALVALQASVPFFLNEHYVPRNRAETTFREFYSPALFREIRESIGADSLGYLSLEGLRKVSQQLKHGHCDACFSAEYPVRIDSQQSLPQLSLFGSIVEQDGEETEVDGQVPDA